MPNLASENHAGVGRLSSESQFGWYVCAGKAIAANRERMRRIGSRVRISPLILIPIVRDMKPTRRRFLLKSTLAGQGPNAVPRGSALMSSTMPVSPNPDRRRFIGGAIATAASYKRVFGANDVIRIGGGGVRLRAIGIYRRRRTHVSGHERRHAIAPRGLRGL